MFTSAVKSDLVNRHSDYLAKGDTSRHAASLQFFERLGSLDLLNESERHSLISNAVSEMWRVHQGLNNFYNEPPFARRLSNLAQQGRIPETAEEEFVDVVVSCYVGNGYGVSWAAIPYYERLIRSFTADEVSVLVALAKGNTLLARRLQNHTSCRRRFSLALTLIDSATVPSAARADFDQWIRFAGND